MTTVEGPVILARYRLPHVVEGSLSSPQRATGARLSGVVYVRRRAGYDARGCILTRVAF